MDPFDAAWHRIDRAETHRVELVQIWNDYLKDKPFDFSLERDGTASYVLRVWQHRPIPADLSVITGEWLYNLRSALDYIVWATAVYQSGSMPPPDEGVLQYPIYETQKAWENNLYRLKQLAPHHVDMLKTMQPFNSKDPDANYLGWLNRLARSDRHRRLNVSTAYVAEANPVFAYPRAAKGDMRFGQRVLHKGRADLARIDLDPWDDDWEISVNPRLGIDPEIAEWSASPFWRKVRYDERFRMFQIFVQAEAAVYEYDCTGDSRKKEALADGYRAECDARPRRGPFQELESAGVEWGPSESGRHTTQAKFEGRDYPADGPGAAR